MSTEYSLNQEFKNSYEPEVAVWCLQNNAKIIVSSENPLIYKIVTLVDDLDIAKEQKHNFFKSLLQVKRKELKVSFDNDSFDANEDAQSNMMVVLKSFDFGIQQVQIRSSTEQTHTFTKEQCSNLSLLMLSTVNNLYSEYWKIKDSLYACTTLEEIDEIKWEIE